MDSEKLEEIITRNPYLLKIYPGDDPGSFDHFWNQHSFCRVCFINQKPYG